MTHNSDGEETRSYSAGHPPAGPGQQPSQPPNTPWTPPAPPTWAHPTAATGTPTRRTRTGAVTLAAVIGAMAIAGAGWWVHSDKPFASTTTASADKTAADDDAPRGEDQDGAASADDADEKADTDADATASTPTRSAPGASPTTQAGANVPVSALPTILASAESLQALLYLNQPLTKTADEPTPYVGVSTDRPDCGGAPNAALPSAYERSGYLAIRTQEFFTEPGPDGQDSATQAVVAFPTSEAAEKYVALETSRWGNCKYKPVTIRNNGSDAFVRTILSPTTTNGVLTVSTQSKAYRGLGCQRGLSSRRNIVIDVQVCGPGGSAQAAELVSSIANRVPNS